MAYGGKCMENYDEAFVNCLWEQGMFRREDIAGKDCLVIGGEYCLGNESFPAEMNRRLLRLGAKNCHNLVLFSHLHMESYLDLTDVQEAVGGVRYDFLVVLSGMETTRNIVDGVRKLGRICTLAAKILVIARTPKDISTKHKLAWYEDCWRFDAKDLERIFSGAMGLLCAEDEAGEYVAMLLEVPSNGCILPAESQCLYYVPAGERMLTGDMGKYGFFRDESHLDCVGIRYRTDKCSLDHNYLKKYELFLERYRTKQIRLLELGVFMGSSLQMWKEYYPQGEIYGVDIMDFCKQFDGERIHVLQRDLSKPDEVAALREIHPDIIVDDASHVTSHQILALFTLFDCLPSGGIYIIEDMETSLNINLFPGYVDTELTAYEVCSRIAEIVARKSPVMEGSYSEEINRIGMMTEMVSIMKGSCIFIKR